MNQALDREISKNLQVQGGLTGVASSERDLIKQLQGSASAAGLNSDAGLKNRQAIESTVGQLQQYRDTLAKTTGNTQDATLKYQTMGQQLLDQIAKTDGANSATYKYAQQLLAVPDSVNTKVGLDNRDALAGIAQVQAALGVIAATNAVATVSVAVNTGRLSSVEAQLNRVGRGWDTGGYTGAGGRYEPRGIVHAGEVVFSQADVAAWGGPARVDALRRSRLPGFADGGIVGGAGYDLSDIFQLISSMSVDPDKLSSAKSSAASASKGVSSAQTALNKILISLTAAERQLRIARGTKSQKDDVAAAARVNKLLQDRAAAYTKLAAAQAKAGAAQSTYNTLLAASKMSAGQLFVKATGQNNAVNQTFLNDLMKIRVRGFPQIALQLLNQGDDEAMRVAHSLASGPLSQLTAANANLSKSGSLQTQLDNLKNQLNGTNVTAAREANAQLMSLDYSAALARYGTTTVIHNGQGSGPDPALIGREVAKALASTPITAVASMDGYRVTNVVADNLNRRVGYGQTGVYAGQGSY